MLTKKKVIISLIFYMIVLFWIISLKMNMEQAVFECMYYFGQFDLKDRFMITLNTFKFEKIFSDGTDFLVNTVFFMPLGAYFFELMKKQRFIKGLGIAFLLTLLLETFQLLTTVGFFTLSDLVSNTLGYVVGYLIYFLLNKLLNRKTINIIFNVFTIFFILLSIYGIINTIINIEIYNLDYHLRDYIILKYHTN